MIPPYEGWQPYCLKCSTMNRMAAIYGGFRCGACGNQIGLDMRHQAKITADLVRELCEKVQCGMMDAKEALTMRNGNLEYAEEYVCRKGLAAVMSDKARFPLWFAYLESI